MWWLKVKPYKSEMIVGWRRFIAPFCSAASNTSGELNWQNVNTSTLIFLFSINLSKFGFKLPRRLPPFPLFGCIFIAFWFTMGCAWCYNLNTFIKWSRVSILYLPGLFISGWNLDLLTLNYDLLTLGLFLTWLWPSEYVAVIIHLLVYYY